MLSRRTFVADATVVFVLAPVAVGCGSDDGGDNACGGAGAASSVADGHSHSLCVPSADLINPPSAGFSYTTSSDDGHTHAVALSATDLQNLQEAAV